jgi:LysM repeat protein
MARAVRQVLPIVLIASALASVAHAQSENARTWKVRPGEALSVIAARFSVTVEELREWNTLEGDRILPGQELVVQEPEYDGPTHEVERGETLSGIAVAHDTTIERLQELNPDIDPERLREGQQVRVDALGDRQRIDYVVRRGDNLTQIAARHRVTLEELRRWNPRVRGDQLRFGTTLRVFSEVPESTSESIGRPHHGRLANAEQLPQHPGYYLRDRRRAYGTLETTLWIQDGVEAVLDRFPDSPQVRVHDLSNREGGRMRDHRSHQSGRDADISFYQERCPNDVCPMRRLRPEDLDAERQWALFEQWLKNDRVEAIFIDHSLQRPLYEEARRQGATRAQLQRWFQYPRPRHDRQGIIRHYPRHRDHAHVRFVCPDTDESCR